MKGKLFRCHVIHPSQAALNMLVHPLNLTAGMHIGSFHHFFLTIIHLVAVRLQPLLMAGKWAHLSALVSVRYKEVRPLHFDLMCQRFYFISNEDFKE